MTQTRWVLMYYTSLTSYNVCIKLLESCLIESLHTCSSVDLIDVSSLSQGHCRWTFFWIYQSIDLFILTCTTQDTNTCKSELSSQCNVQRFFQEANQLQIAKAVRENAAKKKKERQEESAARRKAQQEREEAQRLEEEEKRRIEQVRTGEKRWLKQFLWVTRGGSKSFGTVSLRWWWLV